MKGLQFWGMVLLLVNSLILVIPSLYAGLSATTDGKPWVQILLGTVGTIVSIALFSGRKSE